MVKFVTIATVVINGAITVNGLKKYLGGCATATILLLASGMVHSTPDEVGLVIISDPHVDVKLHQSSAINPAHGVSQELDQRSYGMLMSKIGGYMDANPAKAQAVILLGDLPAHNAYHQKTTTADMKLVFEKYYEKLNPTPLFYVFGNNDSPQRDYGPFQSGAQSAYQLFGAINGMDDGFLSTGVKCPFQGTPCVAGENTDKGYYSAYLGDHLKLLSLNSVLFVSRPGFSPSRDGDAAELAWLADQIKTSQANHENIVLAMHVPPQQWETRYLNSFKSTLKAYPDVVVGMLAAHTHFDEIHAFKITHAGKTTIIPVIYSAGLGTDHGNASSFKTMTFGRNSKNSPWFIRDYVTYNFTGKSADSSTMNNYYDFDKAFCAQGPSKSVAQCLQSHIQGSQFDSKASRLMSQHYTAGNPNNPQSINPSSRWIVSF